MKMFRKAVITCTAIMAVGVFALTGSAASQYSTPAEAAAGVTGRTTESVISERAETGKTYGTIASEAGKLEEFKSEMLEMKKDNLAAMVTSGKITQERADALIAAIEENQALCDGTGTGICRGTGMGCGNGGNCATGAGRAAGRGTGCGGARMRDGSCYNR